MQQDKTSGMPVENWNQASANHDALSQAIFQGAPLTNEAVQEIRSKESDQFSQPSFGSDLDSLFAQQEAAPAPSPAEEAAAPTAPAQSGEKEILTVNGKEVEFDFSDRDKLKAEIQKGLAAQQKLKQAAQLRKENEALKAKLNQASNEDLSSFQKAKKLLEKGYTDHALKSLLGDKGLDQWMRSKIEEEIAYRQADPVERAEIEARRQDMARKYQDDERLEEIQRLKAELEATTTSISEQQYSNYLENARSSYDLGKWIDDSEIASELNDSLILAADSEIIREQQRRERAQELGQAVADLSSLEIKKIYHKHALRFLKHYKKSAEKMADQKIEQQSSQAKQTAQIASQRNYAAPNIVEEHMKSNGSMTDLLRRMMGTKAGL